MDEGRVIVVTVAILGRVRYKLTVPWSLALGLDPKRPVHKLALGVEGYPRSEAATPPRMEYLVTSLGRKARIWEVWNPTCFREP